MKSFSGVTIKVMSHYRSPDLEKNPYLLITYIETNNVLVEKPPDDIPKEIITLATSMRDKNQKVSVSRIA